MLSCTTESCRTGTRAMQCMCGSRPTALAQHTCGPAHSQHQRLCAAHSTPGCGQVPTSPLNYLIMSLLGVGTLSECWLQLSCMQSILQADVRSVLQPVLQPALEPVMQCVFQTCPAVYPAACPAVYLYIEQIRNLATCPAVYPANVGVAGTLLGRPDLILRTTPHLTPS